MLRMILDSIVSIPHMSRFAGAFVLIVCMLSGTGGCRKSGGPLEIPGPIVSPDRTMEIRPEAKDNYSHLVITDRAGRVLFRDAKPAGEIEGRGGILFNAFSFEWVTNSKIVFRGDLDRYGGPLRWLRQTNDSWQRVYPLKKLSPDKKLVIYTWWHAPDEKLLGISILKAQGDDAEDAVNVCAEYETEIVVPDLVDCAEWDGNDAFSIKTDGKNIRWQRQSNDSWKRLK